jgi:hypothetical protein
MLGRRYFGAAKQLPGVKELFEKEAPRQLRRTRHQMYAHINADYYGFRDEEDGVLEKVEAEAERAVRQKVDILHFAHFLQIPRCLLSLAGMFTSQIHLHADFLAESPPEPLRLDVQCLDVQRVVICACLAVGILRKGTCVGCMPFKPLFGIKT